jgi:hypothetical protein
MWWRTPGEVAAAAGAQFGGAGKKRVYWVSHWRIVSHGPPTL